MKIWSHVIVKKVRREEFSNLPVVPQLLSSKPDFFLSSKFCYGFWYWHNMRDTLRPNHISLIGLCLYSERCTTLSEPCSLGRGEFCEMSES